MGHIRVGTPKATPDMPSHVPGVEEGNASGSSKKQAGHKEDGTVDARRSTGVAPKRHDAILPIMPNLPPG